VTARGDNFADVSDFVQVTVDGTAPGLATNLHSTSHTINVWSNDSTLDFAWTAATDNLSGVDGYGVSWGTAPGVFVGNAKDIEGSAAQLHHAGARRHGLALLRDEDGRQRRQLDCEHGRSRSVQDRHGQSHRSERARLHHAHGQRAVV
jgi:hypothetical protein